MASELIHLKSKLLLHRDDEDNDDEYEINTEDELRERLLEYQKIKDMAGDFRVLEEKRSYVYTKLPSNLNEFRNETKLSTNITLNDLLNAFEEFLKRQKLQEPKTTTVTKKEISLESRCIMIRSIIKERGKINFLDLFDDISKPYVIVTFLSILDLSKKREIVITQDKNFGDIYLEGC